MFLIRKILFFFFVAVYAVVCPLLVLYALGYIYNPVKQQFIQTGIIRLITAPPGADVFLEKSHYKDSTPATISGVLAGRYQITLKKKGYKPWSHPVTVEPGKAYAFEKILLIPDRWPTNQLSQTEFESLIPLTNHHLFLLAAGSKLSSFYLFDKNKQLRPLLGNTSPFLDLPVIKTYHSPKSDILLVEGGSFWSRKYLYLDTKDPLTDVNNITSLFQTKPDFVKWDAKNPAGLYAGISNCVNLIDVPTRQAYPCYLNGIRGFGIYDEDIYLLDSNSTFCRFSPEKKTRKIILDDPNLAKQLFAASDFYDIFIADNDIVLFRGTNGDFVTQQPPYFLSNKDIVGFQFNSEQNLLLFWSRKSLSLADFSAQKTDEVPQPAFSLQPLYTGAKNIRQCFWVYGESHVLCNSDDTLYLIELLPQGQPNIEFVTKILKDTDAFYDEPAGMVYYLDAENGRLQELRIIQKESNGILPFRNRD